MRSFLFWDVTQPGVIVGYQCFGTSYQYCIQGSRDRDGICGREVFHSTHKEDV